MLGPTRAGGGGVAEGTNCEGTNMVTWKRTLRTSSSERFTAVRDGQDVAMVDLHYLQAGQVAGTVVLFESGPMAEDSIPDLLASLDEEMLPDVDQGLGTLSYTVVSGKMLGSYEAGSGEDADGE